MAELGLAGATRGKSRRTTIADPAAARPADLVQRRFGPRAPNRLWVADLTYVSTWSGFAYVAFVVDAYARRILGWRVAATMATSMVLDAIEQAIWSRQQDGVLDLKDVVPPHRAGIAGRIQSVVATPACSSNSRWSLRASAGVFHPRILRGRVLSA